MMLDPLIAESNFSLPTQDNLPCDDGVPMETERHKKQMELLIASLEPWLIQQPQGGYVSGNMFIYYSFKQIRHQDFKGPDVFVVLDVPPGERKSWVVWEEGKTPDLIIELLSESTAKEDKTNKKLIYQNQLKVAEYFWFDPFNPEDCAGFRLSGNRYETIPLENNRFLSQQLGLALIRWSGTYRGVETTWLRWATLAGDLLLLPEESAQQQAQVAQQQAQIAQQQAQVAQRRVELVEQQLESETQRAQTAEQRTQVAEAEIARLKALLARQTK